MFLRKFDISAAGYDALIQGEGVKVGLTATLFDPVGLRAG